MRIFACKEFEPEYVLLTRTIRVSAGEGFEETRVKNGLVSLI